MIQGQLFFNQAQNQQGQFFRQKSQMPGFNPSDNTNLPKPVPKFLNQRNE